MAGKLGGIRVKAMKVAQRGFQGTRAELQDLLRQGEPESVETCIALMREKKIIPTTEEYNEAILTCGKSKRMRIACRIWKDMESAEIVRNLNSHHAIMNVYSDMGAWLSSMIHFKLARNEGITTTESYNIVMRGFANNGAWDRIALFVKEMKEDNVMPNEETIQYGIGSCKNSGRWEEAEQMLKSYLKENNLKFTKEMAIELMRVYISGGEYHRAIIIFEKMKLQNQVIALARVMEASSLLKNEEQTNYYFNLLKEHSSYNHISMSFAIRAFGNLENNEKVLELMKNYPAKHFYLEFGINLLRALFQCKLFDTMDDVYTHMLITKIHWHTNAGDDTINLHNLRYAECFIPAINFTIDMHRPAEPPFEYMFACGSRESRHPERMAKISQKERFLEIVKLYYGETKLPARTEEEQTGAFFIFTENIEVWQNEFRRKKSLKRKEFMKNNFYKYKHPEAMQRHKEIFLSGNGLFQPHPEYTPENLKKKRARVESALHPKPFIKKKAFPSKEFKY